MYLLCLLKYLAFVNPKEIEMVSIELHAAVGKQDA
jgi:hypothetical protein